MTVYTLPSVQIDNLYVRIINTSYEIWEANIRDRDNLRWRTPTISGPRCNPVVGEFSENYFISKLVQKNYLLVPQRRLADDRIVARTRYSGGTPSRIISISNIRFPNFVGVPGRFMIFPACYSAFGNIANTELYVYVSVFLWIYRYFQPKRTWIIIRC